MPHVAQTFLADPQNVFLFSPVSVWEVAIRSALGRADFPLSPREVYRSIVAAGYRELPVRSSATVRVADLPLHHRDPFDRLLIAQAIDDDVRLLTADAALAAYAPQALMAV